ncbi:hypothetical protein PR202_gb17505 [Eleusine coracana subsp. coracana]|uniref:Serine-threonine/tyrosine-protein kinase catalytic domain-containing protein n=1 Tax=Eleusine coracana subsp. coracana TaxID=191504 RepID=A0AAV5F3B1_ELECO|nr:hypothetical protein PR202_gb17505 [Eleusine coracana subsp. coracana]
MFCSRRRTAATRDPSWLPSPRAMCKSKSRSDALPSQRAATSSSRRSSPSSAKRRLPAAPGADASSSSPFNSTSGGPSGAGGGAATGSGSAQRRNTSSSSASSASSSLASLAAARASLPDPPVLYPFHELAAATNSFLAKRAGGGSAGYWRCSLRGPRRRALPAPAPPRRPRPGRRRARPDRQLPTGAATLAACLRGPARNPSFTALRTWMSRVQVAADVAQGLEYIHHHADTIHGRVSPSTVLVSDPGLRARITHFGASELAAAPAAADSPYAPPGSTAPSREADVHAFGVLLLELLSGEEPARYRFDRGTKEFQRVSVIETAAAAAEGGAVRSWLDKRLGDSFPVAAAERLVKVGLRCAAAAEEDRPDMTWAAGKVSKVYLESRAWEQKLRMPTEISVSMGPR